MENKRKALGMGLEELFNSESLEIEKFETRILESATKDEIVEIPLSELRSNPYQPRKIFDEDALRELSESIKEYGVFQPIIVKKNVKIATFNSGQESYTISEAIDIDLNIPTTNIVKPNTYALIIGNEDYKTKQPNLSEEANVKYASNDAKIFKEYINKTFGVPNTNIVFLLNATSVEMKQAINKLKQLSSINPNAEFIFYYAGHGLPVGNEKEQFLIPVDVNGSNATFGIKVNDIINELTVNNPKRVLLLFDACFSGAARNESLLSNRGVKVKPKANILKGQTIVISSSSFDEPSKSYVEKQHGMFTYFLLKKIKETKGNINLSDLFDYIQFNVKEKSILINNQLQTPTISTSSDYVKPLNNTFF